MNNMQFRRDTPLLATQSGHNVQTSAVDDGDQPALLLKYLSIARRRKWVILGCVFASLIAGLIITMLMTPMYTAHSTLEIQREQANFIRIEGAESTSSPVDTEFYQTQYGLLQSESLAQRVAVELKLQDNYGFFEMFGAPEADTWFENGRPVPGESTRDERIREAGEILIDHLDITPERFSRLVEVSFTSPNADFSRNVVDAWGRNFIGATLERRFDATAYARQFLEERLGQLRKRLDASERMLVASAAQQGIVNLPASAGGAERSIEADTLAAFNQELAEAEADRMRAESRLTSAGGSVVEALNNTAISGLRQRRAELAAEYSKLLVQVEPGYPEAEALAEQIQQIDAAIAKEVNRVENTLQETYRAAVERESALATQVAELKAGLLDQRRRSIQYNIYQREVDTNRQLYQALLQRYKEIGVAGGVGVNNISIVDEAQRPQHPSSPNLILNMLLALIIGLVAGAGAAFALDQIDDTISDPTDVENLLKLPLLGAIPRVKDLDAADALQDRKSPMAEAYLSVQTNLAFTTDHGIPRSIAITSTRPAEGKSTTSYAIALSLARAGRKVVLVDADMRSPSAHRMFELTNDEGLSNFLTGGSNVPALVKKTTIPNLWLMAAGPQPPNAAELLTSERVETLVGDILAEFDHAVVDAPPVVGLADAPLVASRVEATIFVIESHGTKTGMAQVAINRLRAANARLIGTVLTKFEAKRAHYGYGYDYGYGYGAPSESA